MKINLYKWVITGGKIFVARNERMDLLACLHKSLIFIKTMFPRKQKISHKMRMVFSILYCMYFVFNTLSNPILLIPIESKIFRLRINPVISLENLRFIWFVKSCCMLYISFNRFLPTHPQFPSYFSHSFQPNSRVPFTKCIGTP